MNDSTRVKRACLPVIFFRENKKGKFVNILVNNIVHATCNWSKPMVAWCFENVSYDAKRNCSYFQAPMKSTLEVLVIFVPIYRNYSLPLFKLQSSTKLDSEARREFNLWVFPQHSLSLFCLCRVKVSRTTHSHCRKLKLRYYNFAASFLLHSHRRRNLFCAYARTYKTMHTYSFLIQLALFHSLNFYSLQFYLAHSIIRFILFSSILFSRLGFSGCISFFSF